MAISENLNTAVFTVRQIMAHHKPILHVFHDEDNEWQFLPGTDVTTDDIMIVGLGEILKYDPDIAQVLNIEEGYAAKRESKYHDWLISKDF